MKVLGINAIFHDPAAALVVDGRVVAAAEEERFSRRKHGKRPVPFSAWELPEMAMRWCLEYAGLRPQDLDAVGYSFDVVLFEDAALQQGDSLFKLLDGDNQFVAGLTRRKSNKSFHCVN